MERPAFVRVPKNRYPDYPITLGTPSEGELRRGDVIVRIGNREATKLTHQEAQNLIKNAGNNLQLLVNRGQYIPQSPDVFGPRPLATLAANATPRGRTYGYVDSRHYVPPPPPNAPSAQDDDTYEIERERIAITNQPHRTFPLIQPSVKVRHDNPVGSYLRHVNDPFVRSSPKSTTKPHPLIQQANDALMRARLQESVTSAASNSSGIGSPRGRSETPDSGSMPVIVHRQYNSPIDIYSPQNVAATIAGQTGVRVTPAPNPIRIVDITKSPTYRTIHEDEWSQLHKQEVREYQPVRDKVKTRQPRSPDQMNSFGSDRSKVVQSRTFDMLANSLTSDL